MPSIFKTIARALTPDPSTTPPGVHFHGGANGVYVCGNASCVSPGLDPADG